MGLCSRDTYILRISVEAQFEDELEKLLSTNPLHFYILPTASGLIKVNKSNHTVSHATIAIHPVEIRPMELLFAELFPK